MGTCCSCAFVCEQLRLRAQDSRAWEERVFARAISTACCAAASCCSAAIEFAFCDARRGVDGIKLEFGDVVGGEQRRVTRQIALRAFVGGFLGGDVGFGHLQIRGGGLFELRLGTCVIGGVGFLLRGGAVGAVGGGFARQTNLKFRGICLRLCEIEVGLGLFDFGFICRGDRFAPRGRPL